MKIRILTLSLLSLIFSMGNISAQTSKWLSVGSLHNWYSSSGSEIELGRTPGVISNQQDGLRWPALYNFQDCQAAKSLWIGGVNYDDLKAQKTFNYKVVHMGPRVQNILSEFMPQEFKLVGKFNHPNVFVDGIPAGRLDFLDFVDEVDPDIVSDRMIINRVNTGMGISMTRKIYAYSQQNHDNYFIYDYLFKNTGIVDLEGTVNEQTIFDMMVYFQYRYAPSREGGPYGFEWLPQNTSWGRSTMNEVVYENNGQPFRAQYSWLGKHSQFSEGSAIGGPNVGSPSIEADGRLGAAQFVGIMTLHADTSPSDNTDDLAQPLTTDYYDSDGPITYNNDQYNAALMAQEYSVMTVGRPSQSHAAQVGDDFADQFGGTGGGYSQGQGFGPYTLAPGDSVHIVIAEAVSGLGRDSVRSIGAKWFDDNGPFIKPDGSSTSDRDDYKDAWVFTGKDSLFKAFERAQFVYENELIVPEPPPPPSEFTVTSGGDRINLSWTNNAEDAPGFSGYRLYRAIHQPDTTYELVFECGGNSGNEIVNEFDDTQLLRGFDYYYYLSSYDDGSTNGFAPGVPLESGKFYTMTNSPAFLKRPPGESLADIRVVPNPYNIRMRELQFGSSGPDRIMFFDIPGECTIKIYTERGDLVETIEHTDGSGDAAWNSITSSRQTVVSGVYIATFVTPKGEQAIRKFIIIR
jgi:hypothetical protein